jgi:hypothetical protein
MLATEQLAAYRSKHKIKPVGGDMAFCEVCLLRIHRRRSKGRDLFMHDADAIKRLVRSAALGKWVER